MSACAVECWNRIGVEWAKLTHSFLDDMLRIQVFILFHFCIQREGHRLAMVQIQPYLCRSWEDGPTKESIPGQARRLDIGHTSHETKAKNTYRLFT